MVGENEEGLGEWALLLLSEEEEDVLFDVEDVGPHLAGALEVEAGC